LRLADHLGIQYEQRPVDRTELYIADEAFMCGSSAHITPILSIDKRRIGSGKPGPVTTQLASIYKQVQLGEIPKFNDWLVAVNKKGQN
jgi:branched-chain amino acid aminotransferase